MYMTLFLAVEHLFYAQYTLVQKAMLEAAKMLPASAYSLLQVFFAGLKRG